MLNSFSFLSVTSPNTTGFRIERESIFDHRFRGVCRWATFYQTYGDGNVQHSKETPFIREMLADFLGSLANAIAALEEPKRSEVIEIVECHWPHPTYYGRNKIRFALGLKPHETNTVYYCLDEMKTSYSASKANDRRWEAIKPYANNFDGTVEAAATILRVGNAYDDIHAIRDYLEIEEIYRQENNGYSPFLLWRWMGIEPADNANGGWTEMAWNSVCSFVAAYRAMKSAEEDARRWAEWR